MRLINKEYGPAFWVDVFFHSKPKGEFYLEIVLALYEIYNRQIYFVDKNVELVKNEYEKAKVVRDRDGKYIRLVPQEKHFLRESKKEFDIRVDIVTEWLKNYDIGIFDRVQLI